MEQRIVKMTPRDLADNSAIYARWAQNGINGVMAYEAGEKRFSLSETGWICEK